MITLEKKDEACSYCGHSLKDNSHGLDQNDFWIDPDGVFHHKGSCTYCKECRSGTP